VQLVFIIGIVQKSISAKVIIGNIGRVRSKTMTEAGYVKILLDKKNTQIIWLESEITKLRIKYEMQIKELQKENEKLKAFRQDCVKLTEDNVVMVRQRAETARKLTEAKAIIKSLIDDLEVIDGEQTRELKAVKEAEQFLKEV